MPESSSTLFFLFAVYLGLFAIEQIAPHFKKRKQHLQHSLRNLLLACLNYLAALAIFILLISHVFTWTSENNFGLLNQLKLDHFSAILVAVLLIDLWQYFWHRINHTILFLWRFHQVHHADKDMDASTGVRFHTIEIVLSSLARLAIIPLLGIQVDQLLIYELAMLPVILFHHSNIQLNEQFDRLLRLVIVTPHMHRLHHSDIKSETNSNYASIFSFWDRIFNSYTMRSIEKHFRLGLGQQFSAAEWNSFKGMLKIPFHKLPPYTQPE
jgi:sterol desaturase/sphingolipid hydroxylase (fatty acid hydroxylase superfamily)